MWPARRNAFAIPQRPGSRLRRFAGGRGPAIRAEAYLLEGEASQRAARLLARKHPVLHGRLIPWYHRRRGWTTHQYRLERPRAAN